MSADAGALTEDEVRRVREAVAEAVLGEPGGLRDALAEQPEAYLRLVAAGRVAAEESSALLRRSIDGARAAGHSWDALGRLLGVSRQAAQQRFGTAMAPDDATGPGGGTGEPRRRVLTPLTAFTEMAVLEQEGRRGWHVVDYGTLYHVVESSDRQWEHRRTAWSPGVRRRLEDGGWTLVRGATFPWGYYTRETDRPAEPED